MLNGYGSELLALPITFMAQYWNGNFFVTNTADSCTVIPMSNFTMSNYQKNLIAGKTQISPTGNVKLLAGLLPGPGMILSPPGLAYPGSTDLTFNLGSQSWFGSNPFARATFGIYKSPLIYLRENY
jgi:MSHA biogenesis protein MshQ